MRVARAVAADIARRVDNLRTTRIAPVRRAQPNALSRTMVLYCVCNQKIFSFYSSESPTSVLTNSNISHGATVPIVSGATSPMVLGPETDIILSMVNPA